MLGKISQSDLSAEFDQSSCSRSEPTGRVECGEMRLEIDVEPACAALAGEVDGGLDEACADAAMPVIGMDGDVEDGGMAAAIPGDIEETDQPRAGIGADMAEAPREYRGEICRPAIAPDRGP